MSAAADRFERMAARANARERKHLPLLAHAGLVPVHTPEEQRAKVARIEERNAEFWAEFERRHAAMDRDCIDVARRLLADGLLTNEQVLAFNAYVRHVLPDDASYRHSAWSDAERMLRAGRTPWALTTDAWRTDQHIVRLEADPGALQEVPVLYIKRVGQAPERVGPVPRQPKRTPEEHRAAMAEALAEYRARMAEEKDDWVSRFRREKVAQAVAACGGAR